ncbi:MAG TPA: hypothetical protein VJ596_05665, partial [Gemmatimonadaceae bacterium]|nr:hypothetical protein [Gemmatimonadaceae bacterium]
MSATRAISWRVGLALLLALGWRTPAGAQVRRDTTVRADTGRRADTSAVPLAARDTATVRPDTVQSPLTAAELPPLLEIGERYRWDR